MEKETEQLELLERFYQHIGALTELQSLDLRAVDGRSGRSWSVTSRYADNTFSSVDGPLVTRSPAEDQSSSSWWAHKIGGAAKLFLRVNG